MLVFLFVLSVVFSFKLKQWKSDDAEYNLYRRIVQFGLATVVVSILLSFYPYKELHHQHKKYSSYHGSDFFL